VNNYTDLDPNRVLQSQPQKVEKLWQAPVEPIYTPPPRFEMKDIMDNYDYGNPNLR
jgi:hypothetical protein